jgi:hypothetical protein
MWQYIFCCAWGKEKYAGKITCSVVCILIHSSCCVLTLCCMRTTQILPMLPPPHKRLSRPSLKVASPCWWSSCWSPSTWEIPSVGLCSHQDLACRCLWPKLSGCRKTWTLTACSGSLIVMLKSMQFGMVPWGKICQKCFYCDTIVELNVQKFLWWGMLYPVVMMCWRCWLWSACATFAAHFVVGSSKVRWSC